MKKYDFASRIKPQALVMERAGISVGDPYLIEVTNGQWEGDPREKTLVIHAQVRPGVEIERAKAVFQHAVIDVFTEHVPAPRMMDYYSPVEEKAKGNMATLPMVSLTLIFFPGVVTAGVPALDRDAKTFIATRRPSTVRDMIAAAMRARHEQLR
jgi:hypothetical protein